MHVIIIIIIIIIIIVIIIYILTSFHTNFGQYTIKASNSEENATRSPTDITKLNTDNPLFAVADTRKKMLPGTQYYLCLSTITIIVFFAKNNIIIYRN